jgi:ATP-dependent RNA helicase DeaD
MRPLDITREKEHMLDNEQMEQGEQLEPENPLPSVTIDDLPPHLKQAVDRAGWGELMPVQRKAIPYLVVGRDIMVQSRTGSGKTGAFLLPIIHRLNPDRATCQALVLVPTRELARQVASEAEMLAGANGMRTVAVYGGVGYKKQLEGFRKGAHLVVGTPGRVLDHLLRRSLKLDDLRILLFDEADRMLSMGFYPDMKRVQDFLPDREIDTFMFSATFPPHVMRLAHEFLREPGFLSLSRDHVHVTDVEHVYYRVPGMEKDRALVRIIEMENPPLALVFCNTKMRVHYVATVLQRFGFNADEISSDLSQSQRTRVMERMRKGEIRFLVATDVAARGIDLPELSHAIIYEVPQDHELYIHRAGRTGRAGASGEAISLVAPSEEGDFRQIAREYEIDLQERQVPSEKDVAQIVGERVTALLEARLRERDKLQVERMKRFVPLIQQLSQDEEEASLLAMLLDDFYHREVHASRFALPGDDSGAERQARQPAGRRSSGRGRRDRRR